MSSTSTGRPEPTAPGAEGSADITAGDHGGVAVLEVRDAAVHFGGVKAVDGITMRILAGKIFGIIGPNGSGKSTLLGAVTRLTPLTKGDLLFNGVEYQSRPASKMAHLGVARTFQTVRLLPELTVRENVQLGGDLNRSEPSGNGATSRFRRSKGVSDSVGDAIRRTGLNGMEEFRPDELPYGTQRRVEIARALAMQPQLLLLDEPTAGMNQEERTEISGLLRQLRDEGLTQLLVEHDVQMMIDTCDYLFAMNFGKLIGEGLPRAVVRMPAVQEAYLGKRWRENA